MMLRPDYSMHAFHVAAAGRRTEIWRLILGVVLMVLLYVSLGIMYQQAIVFATDGSDAFISELVSGVTPRAMYVLLFSFGLITIAVFSVVQLLHRRPGFSVIGPRALAIPQFIRVTFFVSVLGAVLVVLPPYDMGGDLVLNLAPGYWTLLLPVSLLAVFIQISAEEIFFRGYLQQQLAARFRSPLVWMVLPSLLFAVGHYQPSEAGENALLITLWAGIFGMLMADLTARAGSLGPALAVHFVNNVTAILITSLPDSLGGLALFHTPFGMDDPEALRAWLPVDFAVMITSWLVARLALRR